MVGHTTVEKIEEYVNKTGKFIHEKAGRKRLL